MRMAFVSAAVLVSLSASADVRRGGIAFHYATPLTARELDWFGRFEVLVTHDPLPRAQVDALRRRGTKLVLYEWAVAFYTSRATTWDKSLPPSALLNRKPLRGHLGANDSDAFYFDPGSREHQQGRAEQLARRLRAIGYDGAFLDTTTSASVHPAALTEYRRRHPDLDYDRAFARFLKSLRAAGMMIVTNQGYRRADDVLPHVDWDVTESLITYPQEGSFTLRPWNAPGDLWNSTAFLFRKLISPAQRRYPRVRFAHINYLTKADPKTIEQIIAIARLYDHDAFLAMADLSKVIETDLYFFDLGRPKPRVETARGAYRDFENGFVAYNASAKPMKVGKVVVPPSSAIILRQPR